LMNEGVNPYDFNDGVEIRQRLRTDDIGYNSWSCRNQEVWDYYVNSNLPLTLLYLGAIDYFAQGSNMVFRVVFSFVDALLSVFIVFLCLTFWKIKSSINNLLMFSGIAAISPTLISFGTEIPEDKGIQTLFMLLAFYTAKKKKLLISSVLLAASVAYKGLGVFIAPVCLFYMMDAPHTFRLSRTQILTGIIYTFLSLLFCLLIFSPFFPEVITMSQGRLTHSLFGFPAHSSIWIPVKDYFPDSWQGIKTVFLFLFVSGVVYRHVFKKFNLSMILIYMLILFTVILLMSGSMDRMNIAIITALVIWGMHDIGEAKILAWYSLIFGGFGYYLIMVDYRQSLYSLGFVLLISLFLYKDIFSKFKSSLVIFNRI